MFDEDQPQEVDDTNISDIESDFEENVQHVDESEPEGVLNVDVNVFLLYSIWLKKLLSFVRSKLYNMHLNMKEQIMDASF